MKLKCRNFVLWGKENLEYYLYSLMKSRYLEKRARAAGPVHCPGRKTGGSGQAGPDLLPGDFSIFFRRPIAASFLIIAVFLLVRQFIPPSSKKHLPREKRRQPEEFGPFSICRGIENRFLGEFNHQLHFFVYLTLICL